MPPTRCSATSCTGLSARIGKNHEQRRFDGRIVGWLSLSVSVVLRFGNHGHRVRSLGCGGVSGLAMAGTSKSIPRPSYVPTSAVLDGLFGGGGPARHVTLDWLMRGLGDRSFGIVLLVLALLAALPGVSVVAGLLLIVPAYQMLCAHPGPVFPRAVATRPILARRLTRLVRGIVPMLRVLERVVHPRWPTPFEATKRTVGGAVLLLGGGLFVPVPLSNVPPAVAIALIAFAYLERDGLLLCAALAAALAVIALASALTWEALSTTGWVPSML
jgi:hypothetical protein